MNNIQRKPAWLKIKKPDNKKYKEVEEIVANHNLHTICTSGDCPNRNECWSAGTATFLILGDICTRNCKFCAVKSGKPESVDPNEPQKIANSIKLMQLRHCVITSVDRDDLEDGGAQAWNNTIRTIKQTNQNTTIESLIPDFKGDKNSLQKLAEAGSEIISHNLETVERLTPHLRDKRANYRRSLEVLQFLTYQGVKTKSGIMVGIGENRNDILKTMDDVLQTGCRIFTLGQYLSPTKKHHPVVEFIHPDVFDEYKKIALKKGFHNVESAPLVRSSYHAQNHI